jgi:hypothetical protein
MPKQKVSPALLQSLAALPEETGWAAARCLKTDSGCSLLGGLAITASQVETLNALRVGLAGASMWMRLAAAIPAVNGTPTENDHDQFI